MLSRFVVVLLALSLALFASAVASADSFNASSCIITNLGGFEYNYSGPALLNFRGYSLTDSGQVTGYGLWEDRNSMPPAIPVMYLGKWSAGTGFVPLYNTGDTGNVYPYAPAAGNDAGAVVYTTYDKGGRMWTSGGGATAPSALSAGANWINSSGLVAAGDIGGGGNGVAYDSVAHTSTTLPGPGLYVNNAGQVAGTVNWGQGFVYNTGSDHTYWPAGTTSLSSMGYVTSISQNGKYAVGGDSGLTNAVVYTATGSGTGAYTTITAGEAYAVNNAGWMGGDSDTSGFFNGTAWLWDGTTLHDLNAELHAAGVPSNYTINAVWGINNSNQILVWGRDSANYSVIESFVLTPGLAGDANLDGKVDVTDLSRVLTNYDKGGLAWAQGDFDGNGTVDITDLSKVLTNYDKSYAAGASAGLKAVPEPSALALVGLGLVGLLVHTWRKQS